MFVGSLSMWLQSSELSTDLYLSGMGLVWPIRFCVAFRLITKLKMLLRQCPCVHCIAGTCVPVPGATASMAIAGLG